MNSAPTRPHLPHVRRRLNWRLVLLFTFLTPALLCMAVFVVYRIFPPPKTNILVLGVDSREGEGWLTRADSIMVVGVQPARLSIGLLSIPRDLFIDVPGYGLQRINTINLLGEMEAGGRGPVLTARSVEQSFGIEVDRYLRLDFNGFVRLIDAVGGVTVDVERAIVDTSYPTPDGGVMTVRFDPGVQTLNGEQALIYARTRYADDDYRRAERQQQIISSLMRKVINPVYWPTISRTLNEVIDTDLSVFDMPGLAISVILSNGAFDQLVIDRAYITTAASGVAVPDYARLAAWLEANLMD